MTQDDLNYVARLIDEKQIEGPVLELGTGYGGATCRDLFVRRNMEYCGSDLQLGPGVDFSANFEDSEQIAEIAKRQRFSSILVLNVLEHTFDPIRVLDNAVSLLQPKGRLVLVTPTIWPLHNFPMDAWRPLPNFYEEYSKRRGLYLLDRYFEYLGYGRVASYRNPDNSYRYPPPRAGKARTQFSRVIHRAFNTFGRGMFFPSNLAIGVILALEANES